MPSLCGSFGQVAIEQGRVEDSSADSRALIGLADAGAPAGIGPASLDASVEEVDDEDILDEPEMQAEAAQKPSMSSLFFAIIPPEHNSDSSASRAVIPPRRMTADAAKTLPSLTSSEVAVPSRRTNSADDPFSQSDARGTAMAPYQSSPTVLPSKRTSSLGNDVLSDVVLTQYDHATQERLLQSHYCQSEVCTLIFIGTKTQPNYGVRLDKLHQCA